MVLQDLRCQCWRDLSGLRIDSAYDLASANYFCRGQAGDLLAALSISGPIERLGRNPGPSYAAVLITGAQRITDAVSG